MRIKVSFTAPKLPILYRQRFMALIKQAIEKSDADYKESLYPDANSEKSKVAKSFCFSVSMPSGRTAKKEKIIIDEGAEIEDTVFHRKSILRIPPPLGIMGNVNGTAKKAADFAAEFGSGERAIWRGCGKEGINDRRDCKINFSWAIMRIEKTEAWITCEKSLQFSDGRSVRGFFGNLYRNRLGIS